ncbi:hypothetical protein SAMN04490243_0770 [Robiginitalea myxolifaciens]|uniref:Sulfotransferase family protein n=1 Tax=Robiginitalea myxolifaciens TaxID=400055 RepID=A0A1I6FVT4_9FLAO|nr:hypothetical protein [Robiginitalea myxolifaciens]SFR34040.1 hypothetical protein SAMN04490243_0770 [Robiginitalea myxolifaciens]
MSLISWFRSNIYNKFFAGFTNSVTGMTIRELAFRVLCSHKNGPEPNIALFCTRRSGSTWILNTLSAHPGMRYVGRPFVSALRSRHKKRAPNLKQGIVGYEEHAFEQFVCFSEKDQAKFDTLARKILLCEIEVYPVLQFDNEFFDRKTNRVVFQVTNAIAQARQIDQNLPVQSAFLMRHPIANALSILQEGWPDECPDFMSNEKFRKEVLTEAQVDLANTIMQSGDELDRHVLDWCFKNLIPHRMINSGEAEDWVLLNYEETVMDPEATIELMARKFNLPETAPMFKQIKRPSASVSHNTKDMIQDKDFLIRRWESKVTDAKRDELFKILDTFEIDFYTRDSVMPAGRYLQLGS